jgi:hypothetical protein
LNLKATGEGEGGALEEGVAGMGFMTRGNDGELVLAVVEGAGAGVGVGAGEGVGAGSRLEGGGVSAGVCGEGAGEGEVGDWEVFVGGFTFNIGGPPGFAGALGKTLTPITL